MTGKSGFTVDTTAGHDTLAQRLESVPGATGDQLLALLNGEAVSGSRQEVRLPDPELFTKAQVAALMLVSVRTLDRLLVRGDVPHVRLSRRVVRFPAKALKSWLESKTQFRK